MASQKSFKLNNGAQIPAIGIGTWQDENAQEAASMIVNPVMAEDIHILEQSITSSGVSVEDRSVAYLQVPRRRAGLAMGESPGKRQWEIVLQLLRPYADELIRM